MKISFLRLFCVGLVLAVLVSLSGCYAVREKVYYSDMNNYITEEAKVENILYNEENNYIVLWLSDIDPSYQSCAFIIRQENATIAIENQIFENIKVGDKITYTSAPRYFGNGYFMPIIGLSIGGTEILNVETGYQNLMNAY